MMSNARCTEVEANLTVCCSQLSDGVLFTTGIILVLHMKPRLGLHICAVIFAIQSLNAPDIVNINVKCTCVDQIVLMHRRI